MNGDVLAGAHEELLAPEVKSKSGFGNHVVSQGKGGLGSDDAAGTVGNVGKRTRVDKDRRSYGNLRDLF